MKKFFLFIIILLLSGCILKTPRINEEDFVKNEGFFPGMKIEIIEEPLAAQQNLALSEDVKLPASLETKKEMKILTLSDNYTTDPAFKIDWGIAILISADGCNILFDASAQGKILLDNMNKLGINPESISKVVISHDHYDHFGGLVDFLAKNNKAEVYILSNLRKTKNVIKNAGAEFIEIDNPTTIIEDVLTTGSLGESIPEQSLILNTAKGLVVITGCAHPGIVEIIKKVKELYNKEIYLVMGGFHLFEKNEREIREIIKEFRSLEVKNVAPCHCTGERAIELFKEEYQGNFIRNGVGKLIEL